jgi:hypothetical protein
LFSFCSSIQKPSGQIEDSSVNYGSIKLDELFASTAEGQAWTYRQMIMVPMQPAPAASVADN